MDGEYVAWSYMRMEAASRINLERQMGARFTHDRLGLFRVFPAKNRLVGGLQCWVYINLV